MGLEIIWFSVFFACVGGGLLSFSLESLLDPRPIAFWRRQGNTVAIHLGLWILAFCVELILFRRPYFAAANVLALLLFVVLVSNAKFHSLREPFVFQDFEYFTDALKHPRLYIPFLGAGRAVVAVLAIVGALYAGLALEETLTGKVSTWEFLLGLSLLAMLGGAILLWGHLHCPRMNYEPILDLQTHGFLAYLWRYGVDESLVDAASLGIPSVTEPDIYEKSLPDLMVVQSESFFDPRRIFSGIKSNILSQFDQFKREAIAHGLLEVPAWGANTVRTEFSFLSGLGPDELGVHRFNPYRRLAKQGVPTLVGFLKKLGYRTVCIHPYPASFYARDKVFPLFGFDEFLDIRDFPGAERHGPYISDMAVAKKACELLGLHHQQSKAPIFIFMITMENHGPLHLERVKEGDLARLYDAQPASGCEDLTIYLRHLENADRTLGVFRGCLEESRRESYFCLFGDHVPIMPEVYRAMGVPDGRTEYVLWGNRGCEEIARTETILVQRLGTLVLSTMGLTRKVG